MESEQPRFRHVGLSSDGEIVFCELDNGKTYSMPMEALDRAADWDPKAKPKTTGILHDGFAAFVQFSTGAKIDFPSDYVLFISEPTAQERAESGIGRRIREIREARQLTLDELAAKSGIAKPNLSRLENDRVTPSLDTIVTLAAALDTAPAALVSGKRLERTKVWARSAFNRWKLGLRWSNASQESTVLSPSELVRTFLATRPEYRYAANDLIERASRPVGAPRHATFRVDSDKWAAELKRVKGLPKRRGRASADT